MNAILLAAGVGTRLRPYTENKPKCMVELGQQSLISRQVELMRTCGIENIIVVGGYLQEKIEVSDVVFVRNPEYKTTNMVASLMCAREVWTGPAIVSYTDILYESSVLKAIMDYEGDFGVVVDLEWDVQFKDRFGDKYLEEAEDLLLERDGRIKRLGLPISDPKEVQAQYIGLMKFSQRGLERIAEVYELALKNHGENRWMRGRSVKKAYRTDMIQKLIDIGCPVQSIPIRRGWLEIDQVTDLELYRHALEVDGKLPYYDLTK